MEAAFLEIVAAFTLIVEAIATVAVVMSVFWGLWPYVMALFRRQPSPTVIEIYTRLGRGLVLSLEIFIAADLLHTILTPTLQEVAILSGVTLLRIILSISLEYELRQVQSRREDESTPTSKEQPH